MTDLPLPRTNLFATFNNFRITASHHSRRGKRRLDRRVLARCARRSFFTTRAAYPTSSSPVFGIPFCTSTLFSRYPPTYRSFDRPLPPLLSFSSPIHAPSLSPLSLYIHSLLMIPVFTCSVPVYHSVFLLPSFHPSHSFARSFIRPLLSARPTLPTNTTTPATS